MTLEEEEAGRREEARYKSLFPRFVELVFYIVVSVSFGVGVVWWNEGPPMVVVERHVLTPTVVAGEPVRIENIVVANKQCPVEVHRTITDSQGVQFTIVPEVLWPDTRMGRFQYVSETTIPRAAADGPANYRVTARWMCNPLQRMTKPEIEFSDVEVEIVHVD